MTDPSARTEDIGADLARISDEELGTLLPDAHTPDPADTRAMSTTRAAVRRTGGERQPRYTPEACRRLFEALLAYARLRGGSADLAMAAGSVLRCTGPWPDLSEPARELVEFALAKRDVPEPYALLAVAGLAGAATLRGAAERLAAEAGPIGADEIATFVELAPADWVLLAEVGRVLHYGSLPLLPDAWRSLAGLPAYVAYARRALEAAADRADAIHAGEIPYRSDKAFAPREVSALGRAARVALLRDEPWLPGLADRLLPGIALAPTAARTVPSQALLYELARAVQDFPTPELVSGLRALRGTVRHAGVPKQLGKMLRVTDAALAARTDVALRLPRLGFDEDGVLRRETGDGYAAVVTVTGTTAGNAAGAAAGDSARTAAGNAAGIAAGTAAGTAAGVVTVSWEKDGRPQRSVPAPVRRDHPGLVREVRDLAKRVDVHLATLARALEGGYASDAVHPYGWWRAELAGHPLARALVHRLVWEVETGPGEWRAVLPGTGADLPDAPDDAPVRLWHPLRSTPAAVRAWRDLLTERRIRQPFKQAFREIYLLTPAEQESRTHSNRFAAHLVHYRRMFALFRARGWTSRLLGGWDDGDGDEAVRTLGEWRIHFLHTWASLAGDHELAATDRVRFTRRVEGGWRDAPLADVPPLLFSEAMRDVDLFVGVTSIAADPDWTDEGPARVYWEQAGFGELTAGAESRRDALAHILPRLRIAGRCALDGRFLVVRGDLNTYRIHLGSGNILMEPGNAYLCVVPARGRTDGRLFLPFEDERLSLILSKAFLLAADDDIKDPSIRTQVERGVRWPA